MKNRCNTVEKARDWDRAVMCEENSLILVFVIFFIQQGTWWFKHVQWPSCL